jgi:dipeptidyl aminopeptidase/acylaminoacyl peptidase
MARHVRIDDLFRFILPGSPALSPDGERIAFCVKRVNKKENRYESHLWLVPTKGGRPRQLTRGLVLDTSPAWSPNGKTLAFLSDRSEAPQVWTLSLEGGEPRRLTSFGGGPIAELSWSPIGREVVFQHFPVPKISEDERKRRATFKHITRLWHKEDGFGWYADEWWGVFRASVPAGRTKRLTARDHHATSPRWNPNGQRIAYVSSGGDQLANTPDLSTICMVNRGGTGLRNITPTSGQRDAPRWSANGKYLYWIGYEGKTGEWLDHEHSVWRTRVSGGSPVALNPGHDRWAMNMVGSDATSSMATMMEVYQDTGEERVVFGSDEDGSYRLYSVAGDGGDIRPELEGNVSVLGLSVGSGERPAAAAVIGTPRDTGEVYRVPLDGTGGFAPLTNLTKPFFAPLRWREPEEFRLKNGKIDLQCWVLKPPRFSRSRKYPCLIEVHGGPMTQYGDAWFHEMQVLAAQGWVVAYCNPRGSSGRGKKFCNVIEGDWGNRDWSDVQALTNHMVRRRYVDSKRMGMLGGSYGGYMTTWAVAHTNRFRAAVTQRQAGDFWVHWGSSDYGHMRTGFFGGKHPWQAPAAYHQQSPNFHVKNIKTPLLIIHSEGDLRCPIAESEALFTAMKVLDQAPCEMVRFEGEFHGLSRGGKPLNREERLERIVDWFERYL